MSGLTRAIDHSKLAATMKHVGMLLRDRQYKRLEEFAVGSQVSARQLEHAINQYNRRIQGLDTSNISIVPLEDASGWSVWANFLTDEEGRSDLSLMMTLLDSSSQETYRVRINDVRVP